MARDWRSVWAWADISESDAKGLPDLVGDAVSGGAEHKTKGAIEAAGEKVMGLLDEVEDKRQRQRQPRDRGR